MQIEDYERIFPSTNDALKKIESIKPVVDFLKTQTHPVTCKEIGQGIWGDNYNSHYDENGRYKFYCAMSANKLGAILRFLFEKGFIKRKEIDDGMVEIQTTEWTMVDPGTPAWIPNPNYDPLRDYYTLSEIRNPDYRAPRYENVAVTKQVHGKHKVYWWVGEN